ncbi:PTS glucose transporter subunit IIA [Treponema primitia]|uniref:PTS sugar transporter subunit IIA n=1 Tax=Treponema primitia TaxID=88058 RepID=UPI00397F9DFB
MFFFGEKKKPSCGLVYATQNGSILPLSEMPDEVFADKVLGDGVCLIPADGMVYSPVDGVVETVADSRHAYGLVASDGAGIMIHIGVDTVELAGRGFQAKVRVGQRVKIGDSLCKVDLSVLRDAGYHVHTAVILTNLDRFQITEIHTGDGTAKEAIVFRYQKR